MATRNSAEAPRGPGKSRRNLRSELFQAFTEISSVLMDAEAFFAVPLDSDGLYFLEEDMGYFLWLVRIREGVIAGKLETDRPFTAARPKHIPGRQTDFGRRFPKQLCLRGERMNELGSGFSPAKSANRLGGRNFFHRLKHRLAMMTLRAHELAYQFAAQVQCIDTAQTPRSFIPNFLQGGRRVDGGERIDRRSRFVPGTIRGNRIGYDVRGMLFTIKDETATEEGLHSVQKFDELLDLESCDNRGRGRSGRSTAMGKGPAGQQGTGASFVEQVPINLAHCAFVASGGRWGKAADHPVEDVDATIKPWATNPSAGAIDKNPGLAVIQRANHNIGPTEITETELSQDIALNVRDLN